MRLMWKTKNLKSTRLWKTKKLKSTRRHLDIAEEIPDPSAEMSEDWDEEEDGEWEALMIPNPEYKGPWKPKMIANPDYKGEWEHPMVPNPDFKEDPNLHARCKDCSHVGFELWQVKSGTVFDDIIVTDSLEEAKEYAKKTFFAKQAGEKEMFEEAEKERQAAEREAMAAAAAEDEGGGEEEDHDEL
jgi:calreticulin